MAANFDTTNYGSMCGAVPPPVVSGQALAVIADPNLFQRYMRSTFPVARCVDHLYSVHVWASRAIETEYNTPEHYVEERKRRFEKLAKKKEKEKCRRLAAAAAAEDAAPLVAVPTVEVT